MESRLFFKTSIHDDFSLLGYTRSVLYELKKTFNNSLHDEENILDLRFLVQFLSSR